MSGAESGRRRSTAGCATSGGLRALRRVDTEKVSPRSRKIEGQPRTIPCGTARARGARLRRERGRTCVRFWRQHAVSRAALEPRDQRQPPGRRMHAVRHRGLRRSEPGCCPLRGVGGRTLPRRLLSENESHDNSRLGARANGEVHQRGRSSAAVSSSSRPAVSGKPIQIRTRARIGKTAVTRTAAPQPMLSAARPTNSGDST